MQQGMTMTKLTERQRQITRLKTGKPFEPTTPDQVAKALGIPVATAARELEAIAAFVQAELTDRQRQIADLYNGGLGTQIKVAKELDISRMTVARELKTMRDLFEEKGDFKQAVETVEPDFSDKIYHRCELDIVYELDYMEGRISRATAYRRTAKYWGTDKILHELQTARRAINRAVKLIEADDGKATDAACQERNKIYSLIMGTYAPPEG